MIDTELWRSRILSDGICLFECCYGSDWIIETLDEIDRLRIELRNRDETILDLQNELAANGLMW